MFNVFAVRDTLGAHYLDDAPAIFSAFVAMITHDALLGVQDRHHEIWGVVVRREIHAPPRFAPLFDSARGLFCNVREKDLKQYLHPKRGDAALDKYIANAHPLIGFPGVEPTAKRKCITHLELVGAIFRACPDHRGTIRAVIDAYDWRHVRTSLQQALGPLCSSTRLQLFLTCLRRRQKALRRAIDADSI